MKFRSGKGKGMFMRQYAKQEGICPICLRWFPPDEMTRDHIVARAKVGSPEWSNIQLVDYFCNQKKGGA